MDICKWKKMKSLAKSDGGISTRRLQIINN
jgi:hypothetical protein